MRVSQTITTPETLLGVDRWYVLGMFLLYVGGSSILV